MDNPVEEIKKKIDIIDFIGSFITLKKTGRNFKALCPFHQEKTPSFIISPERQIWHCFGSCQEGGDIIKFLMKWENITFFEALKDLAQKTGVVLTRTLGIEDKIWKKKERLFTINQLSTEFFEFIFNKTKFGKKAQDYLELRQIKLAIAKKFQIGYAPNSWNSLIKFLKKKKYEEEEISETGLLVKGERGGYYDRFRGRLTFPLKDPRGNIVGFSGRALDEKDPSAKYVNTPETLIYHKRETLFGIDLAKEAIKKEKNVYIVEGEFDMISPYQQGFNNFVAIKGSALTKEQLMMLKRYTDKITLALDTDVAGEEAIKRGIEDAEQLDFEIGVVNFDYAKDPDEAVRKDVNLFKKTLKKPTPIYDFLIKTMEKKYPEDTPFNKKRIGDEMIPYIERVSNPIIQSHYIKKLADFLNVSESSINTLVRKLKQKKKQGLMFRSLTKKKTDLSRELLIQRYFLSLIFQNEDSYAAFDQVSSIISPADFSLGSYQKIAQAFLEFKKNYPKQFKLVNFTNSLSSELQPVFDEVYLFASSELGFENENLSKIVYEIKKFSLKREIKEAIESEDKVQTAALAKALNEVEKKLLPL